MGQALGSGAHLVAEAEAGCRGILLSDGKSLSCSQDDQTRKNVSAATVFKSSQPPCRLNLLRASIKQWG